VSNRPIAVPRVPVDRVTVVAPLPEPSTSYPLRKLAFTFGLALLFLRASMLHQIQAQLMGFSLRLTSSVCLPCSVWFLPAALTSLFSVGRPGIGSVWRRGWL
jgi:hypothetical protein